MFKKRRLAHRLKTIMSKPVRWHAFMPSPKDAQRTIENRRPVEEGAYILPFKNIICKNSTKIRVCIKKKIT